MLREAAAAVTIAQTHDYDQLNPSCSPTYADATTRVSGWGITTIGSATGNRHHPGYNLAKRLPSVDLYRRLWIFTKKLH